MPFVVHVLLQTFPAYLPGHRRDTTQSSVTSCYLWMECTIRCLSSRETFAQIQPPHLRVAPQSFRGPRTKNTALNEDVRAIRNRAGLAHVVIPAQDANAARLHVADDLLQIQYGNRVDSR